MSFMVQDLLDYAQIKAGKFKANYGVFDIRDSVKKVMTILDQKAMSKNLNFTAKYENFGGETSYMLNSDEHRIMQVLLGIQQNAIKFTDEGQVQTIIKISKNDKDEEFLVIRVKDTGVGIARSDQKKLFKLFGFVQDQKQVNVNGIGLGLVISKLIVEQYDGQITFVSKKDLGSEFTFSFKLEKV